MSMEKMGRKGQKVTKCNFFVTAIAFYLGYWYNGIIFELKEK